MSMWVPICEAAACFAIVIGLGIHCVIETIKESPRAERE